MRLQKIVSVKRLGVQKTRDLEVAHSDHNFIANGVVVSNSHSLSYSYLGFICMYLKTHHPLEWWTSVLENSTLEKLKEVSRHVKDIVVPPNVNRSGLDFYIIDDGLGKICFPLNRCKNVKGAGEYLMAARFQEVWDPLSHVSWKQEVPFSSLWDFYERVDRRKVNKRVVSSLIWAGAFDEICAITHVTGRNAVYREYLQIKGDKELKTFTDLDEREVLCRQMDLLAIGQADFTELIETFTGKKMVDPAQIVENAHKYAKGHKIRTGGVVLRTKEIVTKTKGEKMAFVTIGNGSDEIDITVFPKEYAKYRPLLVDKAVLCVEGEINPFGGKTGVVANRIIEIKINPIVQDEEETENT